MDSGLLINLTTLVRVFFCVSEATMMINYEKCPVCGESNATALSVHSYTGHVSLFSHEVGTTHLYACIKCGTVFIPKSRFDSLRNNVSEVKR
jgi:uncharacterized protein with PIN domain